MSGSQANDGPPLLRPVPRRPFELNRKQPTPPHDNDENHLPSTGSQHGLSLNLDTINSRLLDPRNSAPSPDYTPISRTQSVLNMTGSTLMGIYSPTIYGKDRVNPTDDSTPWGTGAETPARNISAEEPYYNLHKERAQPIRRRSSLHPPTRLEPLSTLQRIFYMGSRGLLLFSLGVLYGMLVAQIRDKQQTTKAFQMDGMIKAADGGYDWRYMTFWGVAGVMMGYLLPWFDGVWERAFGSNDEVLECAAKHGMGPDHVCKEAATSTDWALAIRGIGTFVGIAFAIRKLPWDSTLQVSTTLALVNPVLWFLIDRSLPGFILSTTVGITGSIILMGLVPDMVPTPANSSTSGISSQQYNVSTTDAHFPGFQHEPTVSFGGLTLSQETVAMNIWVMSVLFCCCVCFGNIGRWLALNRGAAAKGRWAERR